MSESASLVSRIPVLGWMINDAVRGRADAKYWFAFNVVAIVILLTWLIGYPFVIIMALFGTFAMLTTIVLLTAGDLLSRRKA
ncbi:hypothetical protein ACRC7T_08360 [Segnochrobactraceae bacterium EtOH-i3]